MAGVLVPAVHVFVGRLQRRRGSAVLCQADNVREAMRCRSAAMFAVLSTRRRHRLRQLRVRWTASRPVPMSRKAEQEGALVVYSTDPEARRGEGTGKIPRGVPEDQADVSAPAGRRALREAAHRAQGSAYLRRHRPALRHELRARFPEARRLHAGTVSPEMAAYKPEYQSSPEGYWTWGALVMAAIAYNPNLVTREEAPKTWTRTCSIRNGPTRSR